MFYYADGHHTRFLTTVLSLSPTSPRLLTYVITCLNWRSGSASNRSLWLEGQDSGETLLLQGRSRWHFPRCESRALLLVSDYKLSIGVMGSRTTSGYLEWVMYWVLVIGAGLGVVKILTKLFYMSKRHVYYIHYRLWWGFCHKHYSAN